jgi:cation diffusion facilitator CzcD-associated flavoprotein CzcO
VGFVAATHLRGLDHPPTCGVLHAQLNRENQRHDRESNFRGGGTGSRHGAHHRGYRGGYCRLTSAKALQDYGIPCTVFEVGDQIGRNWAFKYSNGRSSAYRSLHIDTSRVGMSFRDFPMDPSYSDFPHHAEIYNYLQDYVETFRLRDLIRFNTEVTAARRLPAGGWELEAGGERRLDKVIATMTACGVHRRGRIPIGIVQSRHDAGPCSSAVHAARRPRSHPGAGRGA